MPFQKPRNRGLHPTRESLPNNRRSEMSRKRYFVDKRGGCVAVRDRKHPNYDPDYSGLHPDTPDVVEYYGGMMIKDGEGKFKGWTVFPFDVEKCNALCDSLNREANHDPIPESD